MYDKEAAKGYLPFTLLVVAVVAFFLFFSSSKKGKKPHYNHSYIFERDSAAVGDVFIVTAIDTIPKDGDIPPLIEVRLSRK